jgi:hypothetical protein
VNSKKADDSIFEALFRQAVIDDYIEEIDSIPSNDELAEKYPLTPQFDMRMKKLFLRVRRKEIFRKIVKYTQRAAMVFLLVSTLLFGLLLINPEVRAVVGNVIVEWFENFTSITFSGTEPNAENAEEKNIRPSYLPDGYAMTSSVDLLNVMLIIYSDESGNEISFTFRSGDNATNISIGNTHHIIENTTIHGTGAFLAIATHEDSANGVIFVFENSVIDIWGRVHIDELIRMAESVVVVESD